MMTSKVWFARAGNFLAATDEQSLKLIRRLGEGEEMPFKALRPRSLKWHKRYWCMVSRISDHISEFNISLGNVPAMIPIQSPYDLHTAIKLVTGHCITQHIKGTPYVLRIPKPTDFESMSADEWEAWYPRVLDVIHARALPQIDIPEVEQDLAQLAS